MILPQILLCVTALTQTFCGGAVCVCTGADSIIAPILRDRKYICQLSQDLVRIPITFANVHSWMVMRYFSSQYIETGAFSAYMKINVFARSRCWIMFQELKDWVRASQSGSSHLRAQAVKQVSTRPQNCSNKQAASRLTAQHNLCPGDKGRTTTSQCY